MCCRSVLRAIIPAVLAVIRYIITLGWYALPEISNLLLGVLGVLMSFPEKADRLEKNILMRRTIAVICMLVGFGGFAASLLQRREADSDDQVEATVEDWRGRRFYPVVGR